MKRTNHKAHDSSPPIMPPQSEQQFYCPLCTASGEKVVLKKIVVFEEETVKEDVEIFQRFKKRGKWLLKKVGVKNKGSLLTKRYKRLQCPKCKLIYPQSQFYKPQNAFLRTK